MLTLTDLLLLAMYSNIFHSSYVYAYRMAQKFDIFYRKLSYMLDVVTRCPSSLQILILQLYL